MVKRPQTSQTSEKAVLLVERMLNELNWVANRFYKDFGVDLHVRVIALLETPSDEQAYDEHFWPSFEPYHHPLAPPGAAMRDPALARCLLCKNYFWIEEHTADGCDRLLPGTDIPENCMFTRIYSPQAHEPSVYSCDAPEELCPFCTTGQGALELCDRCERYRIFATDSLGEWDDPLVTEDEALEHCAECLEELRRMRRESGDVPDI